LQQPGLTDNVTLMTFRRTVFPIVLVLSSVACATVPANITSAPAAVTNGTTWVRQSAEYAAITRQIYRHAQASVEAAARGRQPGTWAVMLDADETVINNVQYQLEREPQGLGFTQESWTAWVRRRAATPIPGSAEFLRRVASLGGRIAIVTNRLESECEDTREVFQRHTLPFDTMLCRPDGQPSDKNPRFAMVADGRAFGVNVPLDIVAVLGDNILDFPAQSQDLRNQGDEAFAAFGVTFFVLPNPMYGSWQSR
jgi:5'-nucleotidase (lipoprotein e(P4) family)